MNTIINIDGDVVNYHRKKYEVCLVDGISP